MAEKQLKWIKGDMVFLEGEKNDGFIYFLIKGKMIKSTHPVGDIQKIEKKVIEEGDFFGLNTVFCDEPTRSFTVQAIEESLTSKMNIREFQNLLEKNIKTLLKLLVYYSDEMLQLHKKIEAYLNLGDLFISEKEKLYQSGVYYFKNENKTLASYIFKKFIELYPDDQHIKDINEKMKKLN